jgi:anionic cell wall polymer biosynthesis LytR-Cps2A-Psr (LCP) family protein|nr:LCP family protein [Treponema sp.]
MKSKHLRDEQKGFIFLLLIFVIIVGVSVYMYALLQKDSVIEELENDEVLRMLFVIEDENKEILLTNVLVYYPVLKKAAIVNIPNHVGAIYDSIGRVDRIDAVYKEKGIMTYKQEIEKLIGYKISFYTILSERNFSKITDMLGGLRVFIPAPIDVLTETGDRCLLPSGAVNLDGDKIYSYLNLNIPDEPYLDVQDRLQNITNAFFSSFHEKKSIIFKKNRIFYKYYDLMNVNLDKKNALKLYDLISDMNSESIIRQTVTGPSRVVDGQLLLFPLNNGEFIKEAVRQTTNLLVSSGEILASRIYVLEIQNGTSVQGLAHNTSILFQNASYDVLSAINADRSDYEETIVIDHIGNKEMAKMVGDFIRCSNIQEEKIDDSLVVDEDVAKVDFTIILGKDFDGRYVRPKKNKN